METALFDVEQWSTDLDKVATLDVQADGTELASNDGTFGTTSFEYHDTGSSSYLSTIRHEDIDYLRHTG